MQLEPNAPEYEWPLARGERGNEVWFVVATSADGRFAFWYHVELVSTGETHKVRSWATVMDREAGERAFVSRAIDIEDVELHDHPFAITAGEERLSSISARGEMAGEQDISWTLNWEPDTYAFTPIRSQRFSDLLTTTVGMGKYWSRNNSIAVDGTVTLDGETLEFDGARGMQGHIVTPKSIGDVTWLHCNSFDTSGTNAEDLVLEALQHDDKLSLVFRVDDEVHAFNRAFHLLPRSPLSNTVSQNEVGHWQFKTRRGSVSLRATVTVPEQHWHRVRQYPPDEADLYTVHSPFAHLQLSYAVADEWTTVQGDAARAEWHRESPPVEGKYAPDWAE